MKHEFGTQGAAAMAVAIAITKNPLFTPGKEETCIDERRSISDIESKSNHWCLYEYI